MVEWLVISDCIKIEFEGKLNKKRKTISGLKSRKKK